MAFPQVAASTGNNDDGSGHPSYTANLPAGVSAGDRVIVLGSFDTNITAVSFPGSWVEVVDLDVTGHVLAIGELIASGGETSVTITGTGTADTASFIAIRITGAHASTASEAATDSGPDADVPYGDPPSLTPSWGAEDTLWLAVVGRGVNNVATGEPTNFSGLLTQAGAAAGDQSIYLATRELNATSLDPGTFSGDTDTGSWSGATVAVRTSGVAAGHPARSRLGGLHLHPSPSITHGWRP